MRAGLSKTEKAPQMMKAWKQQHTRVPRSTHFVSIDDVLVAGIITSPLLVWRSFTRRRTSFIGCVHGGHEMALAHCVFR